MVGGSAAGNPQGRSYGNAPQTGRRPGRSVHNVRGEAGATEYKADLHQLSSVAREGEQPGLHVPTAGPNTRTTGGGEASCGSERGSFTVPRAFTAPFKA